MIILACNAGAQAGFGHLMRTRALATALSHLGERCVLLGPGSTYSRDSDHALFDEWIPIDHWTSDEEEAKRLLSIAGRVGANSAVLDDYRANNAYQEILHRSRFPWLQFDTSIDGPRFPNILVNPSPGARSDDHQRVMARSDTVFLFGPRFAVLRPEFSDVVRVPRETPAIRVLLTFGAGDDFGASAFVLRELVARAAQDLEFVVVSGEHNPQNFILDEWVRERGGNRVSLLINPPLLSAVYSSADIAIMSGGTSIYEVASCGIPMLLLPTVDNQIKQSVAWAESGAALYLGRFGEVSGAQLGETLNFLISNPRLREEMSLAGRQLVDGRGAIRVAKHVVGLGERVG
ncbi:hypothetical protein [Accumulibacter sp.]|uniref:PseG/SpsG family protein n=1 Tax=Accumulibacter sp. TaxID=2053492 RepID=UPI00260B9807|nr:hypothetical protein [Accumulibacter sp.]